MVQSCGRATQRICVGGKIFEKKINSRRAAFKEQRAGTVVYMYVFSQ